MKKLAFMLCGIVLAGQTAFAGSIGLGYGATSELYKNDENTYVLPIINMEYDNFFVKGATVNGFSFGYNLYQDDFYTFSLYVKPFGGYDIEAKDMKHGYRSIDDRERKFMGGAEVKVYTGIYDIEMSVSADYGKEGGNILFQIDRPYFVNSRLTIVPSANFVYFNSDYVDYYFGVERGELGGNIHRTYDGDSAYSFGLNVAATYRFTDSFGLMGFAGANRVSEGINDSPLVDDDIIYYVGTGLVYTF